MKLSESTILATTTFFTSVAALFTLIGLTTPKWLTRGYGLWNCNEVCSPSAAVLSILALLLLATSVILLVILLLRLFPQNLRIIPLCLIFTATLFLLIATASYLRHFNLVGYSFQLMVTAHAFGFIGSVLLAFWFGTTMNGKAATTTTTTRTVASSPTIVVPSARVL
jgi:membrane associated rhomboid family serine protease